MLSPVLSAKELLALYKKNKPFTLVDARSGPEAATVFGKAHLSGAFFVDLEVELADIPTNPANGGRHPLPRPIDFSRVLQSFGISESTHVVVYDDKNGANAAARFWWMVRAAGISTVQVLDGGYQAAVSYGFPIASGIELPSLNSKFSFKNWQLQLVTLSDVERAASDPSKRVIDVRDDFRFRGEREPIDKIAGHIPGAINIPFSQNLDANGHFLPDKMLRENYLAAIGNREVADVVVHCGSGVTACHTLLAFEKAGLGLPNLYVGSWSEWSNAGKPVAKG